MPKTQYADRAWMLEDRESSRLKAEVPDLWVDPHKTCITCLKHTKPDRSTTFRWWNEERTEIVDWECDCLSQWIMFRYMLAHGIGKAYQRLDWTDAIGVPPQAVEAVWRYIDEAPWYLARGVNLMLHSEDQGTGKTMSAMLLTKAMLARGVNARIIQINSVISMLEAGFRSTEQRAAFEATIMNCEFLVIDDLGKEKSTATEASREYIQRMLDRVIRHRVANAMSTAWTSNLNDDQIQASYGHYITDLLSEVCERVKVDGLSFRDQVNARTAQEIRDRLCRPVVLA